MPSWLERIPAPLRIAGAWLAAATAAWSALLGVELALRGGAVQVESAVLYIGSLALVASAWWSLAVFAAHAAFQLLTPRSARAALGVWTALGLVAVLPAFELSGTLVEGDWISHQPYALALRVALFTILLAGWQGLWLWHAWGSSAQLRQRWQGALRAPVRRSLELAFWLLGASALPAVFVLLGGLLRPYLPMSQALLFPSWLIAATLVLRAVQLLARPRATSIAALALICAASALLVLRALDPMRGTLARNAGLALGGFIALTDTRVEPFSDGALSRFDFSAAATSGACAKPRKLPALPLPAAKRRNVILLSIDTMRRDAIGKRFGDRAVAPNLEAFGRSAVFFERATAAAPITLYSIGSVLTGHSVNQLIWQRRIPSSVFMRTRRLFERQMMFLPDWSVLRRSGFDRLIRQRTRVQYIDKKADFAAPFISALESVRQSRQRAFLWLHLVDAHYPYRPHAEFDFGASQQALYYGEIAYDDAVLGRVLDQLRQRGFFDDSLIIMFSDHGESLGEAGGYFGHGISMLGRFTDVPLYVHVPGGAARTSQAPVMLPQIAPTILHFLDQEIPGDMSPCSLLLSDAAVRQCAPAVSGVYGIGTETFDHIVSHPMRTREDLERRQVQLTKWRRFNPELAVTGSDYRYLLDLGSGAERLFARAKDPGERSDLVAERPDLARMFRARVAAWRREEAQRIACDVLTPAAK